MFRRWNKPLPLPYPEDKEFIEYKHLVIRGYRIRHATAAAYAVIKDAVKNRGMKMYGQITVTKDYIVGYNFALVGDYDTLSSVNDTLNAIVSQSKGN